MWWSSDLLIRKWNSAFWGPGWPFLSFSLTCVYVCHPRESSELSRDWQGAFCFTVCLCFFPLPQNCVLVILSRHSVKKMMFSLTKLRLVAFLAPGLFVTLSKFSATHQLIFIFILFFFFSNKDQCVAEKRDKAKLSYIYLDFYSTHGVTNWKIFPLAISSCWSVGVRTVDMRCHAVSTLLTT